MRTKFLALGTVIALGGLLLFGQVGGGTSTAEARDWRDRLIFDWRIPVFTVPTPTAQPDPVFTPQAQEPTATPNPPTSTPNPPTPTPTPNPPTATPSTGDSNPPAQPELTRISNPNGNCVTVSDRQNVVLENLDIGPCGGHGIYIHNSSNVTVRNVKIRGSASSITAHMSSNVTVEHVESADTQGPMPRGQHVMFDKVRGGAIRDVTTTFSGNGFQEDAINLYDSSDITIEDNDVTGGLSSSGCGIILDYNAQRITVRNNIIRDQRNCGIGVASGRGHLVEGNDIAIYGNVGIYVWSQYSPACGDITLRNNEVAGGNPFWEGQNCRPLSFENNKFSGGSYSGAFTLR